MKFLFGKRDLGIRAIREETNFLMTNDLGGFSAQNIAGACSRGDHAVLMSCRKEEAPNHRFLMIKSLEEVLMIGGREIVLSAQRFADGSEQEGWRHLTSFSFEDYPSWTYLVEGVLVEKSLVLRPDANIVAVRYEIHNSTGQPVCLKVTPLLQFVPKGEDLPDPACSPALICERGQISSGGLTLYFTTSGRVERFAPERREGLFFAQDARDGRPEKGSCVCCCSLFFSASGTAVFSADGSVLTDFDEIRQSLLDRRRRLVSQAGLKDETARALALAGEQFIVYRASTRGRTILAGYPFFEDWGRDTMISLTGCCLSTGRYEEAKSILRTFMAYCREGLMPNLFPEGKEEPRYNAADASLLFILAVYGYYCRTKDRGFAAECMPVMEEIIDWYAKGTAYGIRMDRDGLIMAGQAFDQVTWMDVRIGDYLPTPRHGKPVEINAYWYNALRILEFFQEEGIRGKDGQPDYGGMAELAGKSFREKFWNEEEGCLRDVISGTHADNQIRCNQIWAVAQPFAILTPEQERRVLEKVFERLYTPLGLRTLDPLDPEFHPRYGGALEERDRAYHQGTVWVYPLGAFYLACLSVHKGTRQAAAWVRRQLGAIEAALREGCIGQLPEIYDGLDPDVSRGCYAQAWSVGELLRVYEALERIEEGKTWRRETLGAKEGD